MAQLNDHELPYALLQFYTTGTYECSYLPQRQARSQVAAPPQLIDATIYSELVRAGFRRSGIYTYRPWCDRCHDCVPVRIPIAEFHSDRSQRRAWKKHLALAVREQPLLFNEAHYQLYNRYQLTRHSGGGMDEDSREQYGHFLLQSGVDTRLVEFSENGTVRMISIIDVLDDGLSSVYTFFDPDLAGSSLGTFNILWQIRQCEMRGLPYLYLGYWIRDSRKMAYKTRFRPIEGLRDGRWQALDPDKALDATLPMIAI
jgi:leucyl-tRNA---protein transferase